MWECIPENCSTATQNSRSLSFTYDWAGNLTSETDPVTGLVSYGRSPAGEITSLTEKSYQLNGAPVSGTPANIITNITNGPNGRSAIGLGTG